MNNQFYYFVCNEGSENFLKEEIKKFYPKLTFSFSKKGFLTFKNTDRNPFVGEVTFCRFYGEFVAKGSREELLNKIQSAKKSFAELADNFELIEFHDLGTKEIFELIKLDDSNYYLGVYEANNLYRYPKVSLSENAPSRAYLKILEAAQKLKIEFIAGETALEIGSSPGGATYALLSKGLNVIGVDPGEMDSRCLEFSNFKHFKRPIQDFKVDAIKNKKIDWLLVDMNLAPEASLNEIEKVFEFIRCDFKGAFITLKMTKFSLVSKLPFYKKIITRLGLNPKLLTQLPSHKQEFLLFVTLD